VSHENAHALKVWDALNGDEPDEPNAERWSRMSTDPERVAMRYAEWNYPDDYPEHQTIHVRDDAGTLHRYLVSAVPSVDFITKELPAPTPPKGST
jgi:hypothetical protein